MPTRHAACSARRPRRARRMGACLVPLAAALALAGCASSPSRRSGVAMQAPVNGSSGCYAPAPNLRAAYNRDYTVLGHSYAPLRSASGYEVDGTASWYGWESGKTTSMGSSFNPRAFTAASRVLPLPTCVEVTNLRNGRSALVLVNDRGPFVDSRVMDLSYGAAKALGVMATGTAPVRIVALAPGTLQAGPADVAAPPMPAPAQAQPLLGPQGAPETFAPAPLSPASPAAPESPAVAPSQPAPASPSMQVATLQPLDSQAARAPRGPAAAGPPQAPGTAAPAASDPLAALIASATGPQAPSPASPSPSPPPQVADAAVPPADTAASAPADYPAPAAKVRQPPRQQPPEAPEAQQAQAPMPAGAPQTYVQTGAFTVEGNARQEARRIERAGLGPVEVVPGFVNGRTWYKVQIGPLAPNAQDPGLRDRLARLGLRGYTYLQQ
ncbi:septal ring lytic transglycosylase RlpA family protein [Thiomonas sp. FB-6]|uniref:septal ring lytic transglycosylase RlpA family protein n=1 Tax=Thiomonas sp. FB-6 TaxID=1158291 RepID=UPI00037F9485|nr:SPOR domain-containing protein [Thiomonas sp. FB-6]